jgi:pimeloyl-ACP methyl ester carboxylesterase
MVFNINGLSMHVLEAGFDEPDRPLVLLLHGFPDLCYCWRKIMVPLAAAGYHVIAPDQRGYGRTSGWDDAYDVDLGAFSLLTMARDALALVEAFGYRSVAAVVGHDVGSLIAAWCALIRPDVFRSVDLYQLHIDDPATPIDEMAEAMDTILRSGRARYIGVSNILAYRLAKALGRQDTLKLMRFVSAQPRYNLLFREVERELFPLAQEEGLAVITFNPLAGGLLTGKYKHGDTPEKGRFSPELGGFGQMYHARYWHEREFETIARVLEIAKQDGTPITTLSVAWVLANPAITSVILGASRVEQLIDTLAAADCKLDSAY